MKNVLASVTDKSGLDPFLKELSSITPIRVFGTTSTTKYLIEQGLPCDKIEDLTGFPEILGGRVKTLHPHVFAGILARPTADDRKTLSSLKLPEFDIVICNLYQFKEKSQKGLSEKELIEHIDIGGVTLLRAAAKSMERVLILSSPSQYQEALDNIRHHKDTFSPNFKKKCALQAFQVTSQYDATIFNYFSHASDKNSEDGSFPADLQISLKKYENLRYGENPHQSAAWYAPVVTSSDCTTANDVFPPFEQLQGKDMSANNVTDVYALHNILSELTDPATCIIKHNNPCGVALGCDLMDSLLKAYNTDPTSAFGGVYGLTGIVTGPIAQKITENFVEIVLATDFDEEALSLFKKKKNVRVLRSKIKYGNHSTIANEATLPIRLKDLANFGAILEQTKEPEILAANFKCVTKKSASPASLNDLQFAWSVVKHLTSNAIFIAKDGISLGFGIGQTSRIASMELALKQAGHKAKNAVLASDAFFPATDNIEAAAAAGIATIIQPGGSIKDDEVIAACDKAAIVMLFTGQRCFKH